MDQTHIHLLANHLPVIGSLLGAFVLIYGMLARSAPTRNAAYVVLIIAALGAVVTYATGEGAEESVEHIAGVAEAAIEEHEDAAAGALAGMITAGVAATAALFFSSRKPRLAQTIAFIVLIITFAGSGLTAYTANLGGKIRHTELIQSSTSVTSTPAEAGEGEDDDD